MTRRVSFRVRVRRKWIVCRDGVCRTTFFNEKGPSGAVEAHRALVNKNIPELKRLGVRWWDQRRQHWRSDFPDWFWQR